jgi:hypothetical protein
VNATGYERAIHMDDEGEDSQNVASDIDSQVCSAYLNNIKKNIYIIFVIYIVSTDVITEIVHPP